MIRILLLLVVLAQWPVLLRAQINWGDYSQSFPDGALDKPNTVALILAIPKENNSFWVDRKASHHFMAFVKDTVRGEVRPAAIVARTTFDTARAQFFLHGVNRRNAQEYQFRVSQYPGWKVLLPWQAPTHFTDAAVVQASGLPPMAYLGGYKAPLGSMLIVDVRRRASNRIIATNLVAWEPIRPVVTSLYTSDDLDIFLQKLQYPWARTRQRTDYSLDSLRLPATNTNLVYVLAADIYSKKQVQYRLFRNGEVVRPWGENEYDNSFIWLRDFSPGQYRLQIRYAAQPQHLTEYQFTVEPNWYQTLWFKLTLAGAGIVLMALVLFVFLLIRQRRRTRREAAHKQKLHLELQALYAQLNPHFVFNALSSIQGLVNRQDLKGANDYLSDFARLMRESLASGSKADIPLGQDLQLMETYLKLEQLRFGFQYSIQVDEQLDRFSNNLPPMLWQPVLENAVKHGVASLQQVGQVTVRVDQSVDTLILTIADNGRGIPAQVPTEGFGLRLTRNRIDLLNQMHPEQPIGLHFSKHRPTGTEVTLTFSHWLT